MHTLLVLASLSIACFGGLFCVYLLRPIRSWDSRRPVQFTGLVIPVAVLGMLALGLAHFVSQLCWMHAPTIDTLITQAVSISGALAIVAALALNAVRAVLLPVQLRRRTWEAPDWLRELVAGLSAEVGLKSPPQVRVAASGQPLALVAGPLRPHLVVSGGLVALLDREELSAVLCHELLHIRRADLWWSTLASALYDLTWFLPTTRRLYAQLMAEQEVACDDHIVGESRRLALAGALARVWQAQVGGGPHLRGALALLSHRQEGRLEVRMRRLLERPGVTSAPISQQALLVSAGALGLFALVQLGATLVAMANMGCNLH